jgi:probable HAF family extracellular repeat protein
VIWEGEIIHEFPIFSGDSDGFAIAINDKGQAVGQTGDCTQPFHGVIWNHGAVRDLGNLGDLQLAPQDINNKGQVVGYAFSPSAIVAFVWEDGVAKTLGTLAPDVFSVATAINDQGQIVGDSCDEFFDCRAFLWQNGTMTELNDVVAAPNAPFLENANSINSRAQIAGKTTAQGTPIADAFLAIPTPDGVTTNPPATQRRTSARRILHPEGTQIVPRWRRLGYGRFLAGPQKLRTGSPLISAPIASLSPSSVTFLTRAIGTTSPAKTVVLKNTGTSSLSITSIAIAGTNAGDFSQTNSCPATLAAGASCTISVKFKPTASGTRNALLRVSDNAAGSPQEVTLSGIGTTAELSPLSISFGVAAVGTTTAARAVTLTNLATTTLNITGIAITGINPGDFAQTNTCGNSLSAGASCSISVSFKPTASGARTAALSVSDNAAGSPQKVTLGGVGTTVKLSPTSLNFGLVVVGMTSAAQNVTLTNVGTTILSITGIAITGTNAGDFSQTHTCGSSLSAGTSCSISVTFQPAATGTRTAVLSVTDNAAGSPQKVTLSGKGASPFNHCLVSGGVLTGDCLGCCAPGGSCILAHEPTRCPPGQKAKNAARVRCRNGFFLVDLGTSCSF